MGIWSCLGTNLQEVKESLYNGRSGIGLEQERITYGYQSGLTGIVKQPVLKGLLHRRLRIGLSEEAEYAYMAARECFEQAGVDEDFLLKNEVGVIFGNDSSAKPVIEAANIMAEKHDSELLGSGLIFQSMNSTVNMNLSTIFHLRGINFTISSACASGSHSIGIGYLLIKQGLSPALVSTSRSWWAVPRKQTIIRWLPSMPSELSRNAWTSLPKPRDRSTVTATA